MNFAGFFVWITYKVKYMCKK